MRIDEKYKRLIKCFFSVVMILLLTVTYHQFWVRYYNKIILYPFYRRGMWMMAGIYAAMLIFFMNAYGGFKIGYLRKGNLIYSQALSLIFTNIFTYFQLSVLDKKLFETKMVLVMKVADVLDPWSQAGHEAQGLRWPRAPARRSEPRQDRCGGLTDG